MVEVTLREIDRDSWEECMNLTLRMEQGGLMAPNSYRTFEFKAEPTFVQVGIYNGDVMVGYAMYGIDPDDGKYWIFRLMIDMAHQGRGYGKAALREIIRTLSERSDCDEIYTGYRPENFVAAALYGSLNFARTGQMLCGEYIAKLVVNNGAVKPES
ncbi:MAG: GNAT family N-acetyltransferase [Armatimonadetes bacterium]|nr:GNAT family N-acetyltransferase [Armatimonadota bacterium]